MTVRRAEVAVIGGGPAGAAAAIRLAAAGRDVLLLERDREARHKVCGEFLSGEALAALAALGVPAAALSAAPIDRVRIVAGRQGAEGRLPFPAAGLSRAVLDRALLERAERAGAEIARGASVRGVEREGGGALLRLGTGDGIRADSVVLATGKSDLAGFSRTTRWSGRDGMIGLKMHLRLDRAARERLGAAVELFLFPGGCAGFQPVGWAANLCVTLERDLFARVENRFDRLLAFIAARTDAFAAALGGAEPLWARPQAIARVPYGFRRGGADGAGVWRVGDQIAVTASFTGDGIAIALESGIAAAEAILSRSEPQIFERRFGRRAARQLRPAMLLQGLVDRPALHRPAIAAARAAPWAIGLLARWTRLPQDGGRPSGAEARRNPSRRGSLAADRAGRRREANEEPP